MEKLLSAKHLFKYYDNGNIKALDDVSFSVKKGELIGILGRNGAGKSTMFKIICSVLEADKGEVLINNPENRFDFISYLPEVRGLNPRELVFDQLVDLLCYKGIKRSDAKRMIKEQLKLSNMEEYKDHKVADLSKGNQQKIQFISAIANQPELLILDEPFSGLDVISADFFWETLLRLNQEGTTIIFSTHGLDEKLLNCNKFMFFAKGKIQEYDTLEEIQNHNSRVLEFSAPSLSEEVVKEKLGNRTFHLKKDMFYVEIEDDKEAKKIFEDLGSPYCTRFVVRKKSLEELFRIYNGDGEEHGK